jgi:hypothetical protein
MQIANIDCHCIAIVFVLIFGLIIAPIAPHTVLAAEQGATAAGSSADEPSTGAAGGSAAGVDVSGSPGKATPSGKGALAPPPKKSPPTQQPTPVKSADQQKKTTKAIGASAGKAGTAGADTETGGISMGWKITAGVLGVGLLLGLAGGGGGGGSSGGHQ